MVVVSKLRAIVLAALLLSPTVVGAKTLKYSDHERLGGMRTRFINDVFFSAIERESNGRLKIEAHWEGKLSSSYDALSVVGKGRATDLAIVVPEYAEKNLPLHQIFKGFPVGPSGDRQVSFFRRVFAEIPEFRAELAKENVVPILYATGYPVAFFATKPLDSLDGIKAGKWRTASFWHADFLRNARAVPVSMPWGPKISEALQGGQLDGLMVNVDGGAQLNIGQAAPNVLISKNLWLGHVYLLVMNKDTWNGLAKEDQEAIGRAAESAYTTLGSVMNSSFDTQVNDLRKDGAKVRVLSPQEMAQWSDATDYQEVQNIWVNKQKGGLRKKARINLKNVRNIFNSFMN